MTSDYFSNDSTTQVSSAQEVTWEKIKKMMKDLQLPLIKKPFLKKYLGEVPKFEYMQENPRRFKVRSSMPVIIHNAYIPYFGDGLHIGENKIQRAARILLRFYK